MPRSNLNIWRRVVCDIDYIIKRSQFRLIRWMISSNRSIFMIHLVDKDGRSVTSLTTCDALELGRIGNHRPVVSRIPFSRHVGMFKWDLLWVPSRPQISVLQYNPPPFLPLVIGYFLVTGGHPCRWCCPRWHSNLPTTPLSHHNTSQHEKAKGK